MKTIKLLCTLMLLIGMSSATTITANQPIQDPRGGRFNGKITFALPSPATNMSTSTVIMPIAQPIRVVNGQLIGTLTLPGNDILSPKMYYSAYYSDSTGRPISVYHYYITGTTFDLGSAPLTPVTTSNVSITDLLGLNSVSATTGMFTTLNITNLTSGNAAIKNQSADHIVYLSPNGSDSNDGLSWGSAKLTPQAAFNLATTSGTLTGTVLAATGSYSCPTTWYSNMSVIGVGSLYHSNLAGSFGTSVAANNGVVFNCTSGANHTIDSVTNLAVTGVIINFNNSGGGLILKGISASTFNKFGVNFAGTTGTAAVALIPGTVSPTINNAFNKFYDLVIVAPGSAVSADCLTLTGTGTPNAGSGVTDNQFYGITCSGRIRNGVVFGLNSDTNKLYGVDLNNTAAATGDALVFNSSTPASDQDSDNEIVDGLCVTGAFSHLLSMGQSFGNDIRMCSGAGEVIINVLGGTPAANNRVTTTGLFGIPHTTATANLVANKITRINGTTTTAAGVPIMAGYRSDPGRTTSLGTTTVMTTAASNTIYRFSASVTCTAASAAATITMTFGWTDVSNTTQSTTSGAATCTALNINSQAGASIVIETKASTNITIATTIVNTPTYDLRVAIEQLGTN